VKIEQLANRLESDAKALIAGEFSKYAKGKEYVIRTKLHPIPTDEKPNPIQTMAVVTFEFPDWFPSTRYPRACSCFAMDIDEPEVNSGHLREIIKMRVLDALEDLNHLRQKVST
jgi:hypothetical protein